MISDLAKDLRDLRRSDKVTLFAKDVAAGVVAERWVGQTEGHVTLNRHGPYCLQIDRHGSTQRTSKRQSDWAFWEPCDGPIVFSLGGGSLTSIVLRMISARVNSEVSIDRDG